jgi:hypothetical protein
MLSFACIAWGAMENGKGPGPLLAAEIGWLLPEMPQESVPQGLKPTMIPLRLCPG